MSDITLSKAVRTNLLSLQNTATMMSKTQERLATGNKVNSALDNPTNFFTASSLNSRAGDLNSLMDSMSNGIKTLEAADNGLTAITKTLESMQSTLRQARQDKSFQNAVFEVNANSVLTVNGGQFELPQDIKLGVQTPGVKAELKTIAGSPYYGPSVSTTSSEDGIGARTLISTDTNGLVDGAVIKVSGLEITLADGNADGNIDATELATQIDAQLNSLTSSERNKYTVNLGAVGTANEGKVIIESVSPSAAAAPLELVSGSNAAAKASTSFNYAAITSSVAVGGQAVATGTTFDQFVANLKLGEEDGGYTVTADPATKNITLTSKDYGTGAPSVTGVPTGAAPIPGNKASAAFQLTSYDDGGTDVLASSQAISVSGATAPVSLTSGMSAADVKAAFEADANINAAYDVAVDATFNVSLVRKTVTADAAPTITSTKGAAAPTPAASVAGGGLDFTDDGDVQSLAGSTITSVDGQHAYTFTAGDSAADQLQALTDAGFTVSANVGGGLDISRTDGKNFTIVDNSGGSFGTPTTTYTTTGGVEAGIVGGQVAGVAATNGVADIPAVIGQTSTVAVDGIFAETVDAKKDTFIVTYDGKSAEIAIGGIKGGIGSTSNAIDVKNWQDATVAKANADLKTAGITGVEATFGSDGKLSIIAKSPEAKSIAISGDDGIALFGTDNVVTGSATIDGYSSSSAVDKFVEEINRTFAGKLRASNDNGKLRMENLSTKELDVSFDSDGPGVGGAVSSKIAGNAVRENLANQFNELRDQLDKLSDDASFNGINLLRGDNLKITFNESGNSFIDVQTPSGGGINSSSLNLQNLLGVDLDTDAGIDELLGDLKLSLSSIRSQASKFGSNLSIVQNRQDFTKQMINTLETGAANLTLADMNEEAANLLALQTRQSLSSSSLSLASQADQSVLQLLQ